MSNEITAAEREQLIAAAARAKANREGHAKVYGREAAERKRKDAAAWDAQLEREGDRKVLEQKPRGPNLPPFLRRSKHRHVVDEDLEAVIPDGWGTNTEFRRDAAELGRRIDLPASAVFLLWLGKWVHGLAELRAKSSTLTGGSFQLSIGWLARKLGYSERQIIRAFNALDPWADYRRQVAATKRKNWHRRRQGKPELEMPKRPKNASSVLMHHFGQVRPYRTLASSLPASQRTATWMDAEGTQRTFVELCAVSYPTAEGVRVLRRRARTAHRPKAGRVPLLRKSSIEVDLMQRLSGVYRQLRARLNPDSRNAAVEHVTPNSFNPLFRMSIGAPGDLDDGPSSTADPGQGDSASGLALTGQRAGGAGDQRPAETASLRAARRAVPVGSDEEGPRHVSAKLGAQAGPSRSPRRDLEGAP